MQRRGKVIVAVAVLGLGAILFTAATRPIVHTREGKTRAYIRIMSESIENYRHENGHYPTTAQGLQSIMQPGQPSDNLRDGWGNPFNYRYPSQRREVVFELWSYGADGKPGGDGEKADIGNWTR